MREAAQVAKVIKQELKKHWPTVKFSAKSEYYAGGNSVHVSWNYGPTSRQVAQIIDKYQHGHFDGMTDMYEYRATTTPVSAKYVFGQRSIPYEIHEQINADLAALLGVPYTGPNTRRDGRYISDLVNEILSAYELPADGYKGMEATGKLGAGHLYEFYKPVGGKFADPYGR